MRILALDQASRTSGYAVFEDGKLLKYGKFTYDDYDFGVRLNKIRSKVKSIIEEYKIDEVVLEDIQLQENVDTFKKLAEVYGVLYELATELKLPNSATLASVWKSQLGIKGYDRTAQKRNAQEWVVNTYGVRPTQDECDAICIGAAAVKNQVTGFDWSE